jgi:hypothetical protein
MTKLPKRELFLCCIVDVLILEEFTEVDGLQVRSKLIGAFKTTGTNGLIGILAELYFYIEAGYLEKQYLGSPCSPFAYAHPLG